MRYIVGVFALLLYVAGLIIAEILEAEHKWLRGQLPPGVALALIISTALAAAVGSFCFTQFGSGRQRR